MVRKLWQFFPYGGSRLSAGKTWLGYYFPVGFKDIRGWFGFITGTAEEIIEGRRHGVELIVATSFPMHLCNPPFRPIRLAIGPGFLGLKPDVAIFTWAVDYAEMWETSEAWRTALAPVREQVEQLAKKASVSEEVG